MSRRVPLVKSTQKLRVPKRLFIGSDSRPFCLAVDQSTQLVSGPFGPSIVVQALGLRVSMMKSKVFIPQRGKGKVDVFSHGRDLRYHFYLQGHTGESPKS